MHQQRQLAIRAFVAISAVALLSSACVLPSPTAPAPAGTSTSTTASTTPHYPIGNVYNGYEEELVAPQSTPPGADIWSCKPSAAHPYPVVLVHGTFANMAFSWQTLSPELADAGYCVYALNYGATSSTFGRFYGLAPIAQSAAQLGQFVTKVLAATGAKKVDIVGHSQGGMMPRYYIDFLGGATKVHILIGLAPSNHGTTVDGLLSIADLFQRYGLLNFSALGCTACTEQEAGSAFLKTLNAGGGIVPSVTYAVIESKYDEVVTPYTSAFLPSAPNVWNITLQNYCATDYTEHLGIIYDPVAMQLIMNILGPDSRSYRPKCTIVPPIFS